MERYLRSGGVLARLVGHGVGVLGTMMGLAWITSTINPHLLDYFPFEGDAIRQTGAGFFAVTMMVLGTWLITGKDQAASRPRGRR